MGSRSLNAHSRPGFGFSACTLGLGLAYHTLPPVSLWVASLSWWLTMMF